MGSRLLRRRISYPLRSKSEIDKRLTKVNSLYRNEKTAAFVREKLSAILDIERLSCRITMRKTHGKDMLALKQSLGAVIRIKDFFKNAEFLFLHLTAEEENLLESLYGLLENSINDECTVSLTDGKVIKKGYSDKVDRLKSLRENANDILEDYLLKERKKTGIHNLKTTE